MSEKQRAAAVKQRPLPPVAGDGPLLAVPLVIGLLAGALGASLALRTARRFVPAGVLVAALAAVILLGTDVPAARVVQGLVFGVALTIVVMAGGELATSAMMILTQGALGRSISWARAAATLLFCMVGNLLGAMVFAAIVHESGALGPKTAGGRMIATMIEHKAAETTSQLFFRGILCNVLVCLAIWSAARLQSEGAKIAMIFACVMVFITSGFEHVVANMTTFSLGLLGGLPGATWAEFARNVGAVGLGNLVGGGLLVGAAYVVAAGRGVAALPQVQTAANVTSVGEPVATALR